MSTIFQESAFGANDRVFAAGKLVVVVDLQDSHEGPRAEAARNADSRLATPAALAPKAAPSVANQMLV